MENNMTILGRDDLLSKDHLERKLVPVPELNGSIYLRELGTPQVIAFNNRVMELSGGDSKKEVTAEVSIELMAYALSLSACDEQGNLIFTEDDVKKLMDGKFTVLINLSTEALQMSGLKLSAAKLQSEVSANLKNGRGTSLSTNLPTNSKRRKRK